MDDGENNPRYKWRLGSVLSIFSRSQGCWFIGVISETYFDKETIKEWFIVKYDKSKSKHIQRLCTHIKPLEGEDAIRYSWTFDSICSIYSRSAGQWFQGKIHDIYHDSITNKEWLVVKYNDNKTKSIQRLCEAIKPLFNEELKQDTFNTNREEMIHKLWNDKHLSDSEVN